MISLVYNIGVSVFVRFMLLCKFNVGDIGGVVVEFLCWNWVGGKVMKGLVNCWVDEWEVFQL